MKIKSKTDVITNSSSEVYAYFDKSCREEIREAVSAILEVAGTGWTFDELFRLVPILGDNAEEIYEYETDKKVDPENLEEFHQWCQDYMETQSGGMPIVRGYKLIPLVPGHEPIVFEEDGIVKSKEFLC